MEMKLLGISNISNELDTSKLSKKSLSTSKIAVADSLVISKLKQEARRVQDALRRCRKNNF